MTTYAQFRPTAMDPSGLGLDSQQDWLVCPCTRNRDSGCLDNANFQATLNILGGESDTVEVHRFGHWACGWFEIVLLSPERAEDLDSVTPSDYPVLDDHLLSELENEEQLQCWPSYGCDEFREALADTFGLSDTTKDYPTATELYELFTKYDVGVGHSDEGPSFNCESTVRSMVRLTESDDPDVHGPRDTLAAWFREIRRERVALAEASR